MGYYVPRDELPLKKPTVICRKCREYISWVRQSHDESVNAAMGQEASTSSGAPGVYIGPCDSTTTCSSLVVKLPCMTRKRKRTSTIVRQKNKEILNLTIQNKSLAARNTNLMRKLKQSRDRMFKYLKRSNRNLDISSHKKHIKTSFRNKSVLPMTTPQKRDIEDLRDEGISPRKVPRLYNRLTIHHHVVHRPIRQALSHNETNDGYKWPKVCHRFFHNVWRRRDASKIRILY